MLFSPLAQNFIDSIGWSKTLTILALIVMAMLPLALLLPSVSKAESKQAVDQTLREAVSEAFAHRGFVFLTVGFLVCGCHVAIITAHYPVYVIDLGLDS